MTDVGLKGATRQPTWRKGSSGPWSSAKATVRYHSARLIGVHGDTSARSTRPERLYSSFVILLHAHLDEYESTDTFCYRAEPRPPYKTGPSRASNGERVPGRCWSKAQFSRPASLRRRVAEFECSNADDVAHPPKDPRGIRGIIFWSSRSRRARLTGWLPSAALRRNTSCAHPALMPPSRRSSRPTPPCGPRKPIAR